MNHCSFYCSFLKKGSTKKQSALINYIDSFLDDNERANQLGVSSM